jgi:hypothetical protein
VAERSALVSFHYRKAAKLRASGVTIAGRHTLTLIRPLTP